MTTNEIATKLVSLCREGKITEVLETLFANNAKSVEMDSSMGNKETIGLEAIKNKSKMFAAEIEEFYGQTISDPIVIGNTFAVTWFMDRKLKGQERSKLQEVCAYKVEDGKIILEQFIY